MKRNWHLTARRLARMLDQAITIPAEVLESLDWSRRADDLIRELGIKPGSSKHSTTWRRLNQPRE